MPVTWLITGATSGFGRLVAERAPRAGAHVIAVGRRADRLADLARSAPDGQVSTLALDITAPDAEQRLAAAIAAAGGVDVLINNAGSGLFSASKAAVELLSEALAQELAPTGVTVTIVEPGVFATEFLDTAHVVAPDETYAPTVGASLSHFQSLPAERLGAPGTVADAITALATMPDPPLRLAVGADAIAGIRQDLHVRLAELDAAESLPRPPA